jgi:hypothetical protein
MVLARFAFDDPPLRDTISSVCVAHGLSLGELADDALFPMARDIRGEKANVRLLAILLRLGDLLDMDADRACPLLSIAGGPVPPGSIAHWSQYRRISHRLTSPERIEIVADCNSQSGHRVLLDWCNWIEAETHAAPRLLAGALRHADWRPPTATVSNTGSIRIRPSRSANYIPCDWRLELDESAVLDRLINDLYSDRLAFLRELLQNAIDATRCKIFLDVGKACGSCPSDLRALPNDVFSRYPLTVRLSTESIHNAVLDKAENVQIICVEDSGIGMDIDVIQRYFLQVGRSFYRSPAFLREFPFTSIGRYGTGFLSVFSISDRIVVDTRHYKAVNGESIRLTLTGPKSYFLRDRGLRASSGTTITIRLREPIDPSEIVQSIVMLCRRVEIPIRLDTSAGETVIEHETSDRFTTSDKNVTMEGATLNIRAFPFKLPNVAGEVYIFEHKTAAGLSWCDWNWANYRYESMHPLARPPSMPASSVCINGLDYQQWRGMPDGPVAVRLDYRGPPIDLPLDRSRYFLSPSRSPAFSFALKQPGFSDFVTNLILNHLQNEAPKLGTRAWEYKQALANNFPNLGLWADLPDMLLGFVRGNEVYLSISDAERAPTIVLAMAAAGAIRKSHPIRDGQFETLEIARTCDIDALVIPFGFTLFLPKDHRTRIFAKRQLSSASLVGNDVVLTIWDRTTGNTTPWWSGGGPSVWVTQWKSFRGVGFMQFWFPVGPESRGVILNALHPLVAWIVAARAPCESSTDSQSKLAFATLIKLFTECIGLASEEDIRALERFLSRWQYLPVASITGLPPAPMAEDFSLGYR